MPNSLPHCPVCGKPPANAGAGGQCVYCLLEIGLTSGGPVRGSRAAPTSAGAAAADRLVRQGVLPSFGDYELESEIARGGMGVVYRARQRSLDRVVAVKLILAGQLATPEAVQRFRLEARAAAHLQHPGIVRIHEIGECETQHYFSMELVEGASLAECLDAFSLRPGAAPADRRQQERCVAELIAKVARALDFAHRRGVLHRDLKPSNILIDEQGQPRLTDFGLAKLTDPGGRAGGLTVDSAVLGTPGYLAPEQAAGLDEPVTTAADIYGLGATLYELLTGRPPFVGPTAVATMMMAVQSDPAPPRQVNAQVHRDLETVALKCLERSPQKRYPSAAAVAEELERFLRGEPVQARPVGRLEHAARWCRRNPLAAASVGAAAAAIVAALVLVSWSYVRADAAFREEARQRQEAGRRERAERWQRYRSNLIAAAGSLQLYNTGAADDALEAAPVESRNWEWRHFRLKLDAADCALSGPVRAKDVRLSADGRRAVTWGPGAPPRVLDVAARQVLGPLAIAGDLRKLELGPDGAVLACVRADNALVLWDVAADRQRVVLRGPGPDVGAVRFSPDGASVAAACADRAVRVWAVATGAERFVLRGHADVCSSLTFSPDGRRLASAGHADRTVRLWDMADGRPLAVLAGHEATVEQAFFGPRGERVLTCELAPSNAVRVWDAASGRFLGALRGLGSDALSVAVSPDGTRIATGTYDQAVVLWDAATFARVATLRGHKGWVFSATFSPDGRRIATASRDRTLRLWDAATGEPVAVLAGHTAGVTGVRYSADGATLTSQSDDGTVRLWDARRAETGDALLGHGGGIYGVAFHPDGARVASASRDGTARLWDATAGRPLAVLPHAAHATVAAAAFHPAGRLLATIGRDDSVRLWDVDTGRAVGRLSVPTADAHELHVAFSPRGDLLACGGGDHAVHRFAITHPPPGAGGAVRAVELPPLLGHTASINDVAFSPDGSWLASAAADGDATIRVWDLSGNRPARVLPGFGSSLNVLALSRDGRWLASGAADGTVRLWDTATWEPAGVLTQGSTVYGLAFTPDGTRLACACANNVIRLWDVASREAVCDLLGHDAYVHAVAFSPDGTRLLSGSGDQTLRVWDTLSPPAQRATRGASR